MVNRDTLRNLFPTLFSSPYPFINRMNNLDFSFFLDKARWRLRFLTATLLVHLFETYRCQQVWTLDLVKVHLSHKGIAIDFGINGGDKFR